MELTQTDKHLITGLAVFGLTEKEIIVILSGLRTQEQRYMMVDYLMEHEGASMSDILEAMVYIRQITM